MMQPSSVCPHIEPDDEKLLEIFRGIFLRRGRVSHLHRVLGYVGVPASVEALIFKTRWHPDVLRRFVALSEQLFSVEGPLPLTWRVYLAIVGKK